MFNGIHSLMIIMKLDVCVFISFLLTLRINMFLLINSFGNLDQDLQQCVYILEYKTPSTVWVDTRTETYYRS